MRVQFRHSQKRERKILLEVFHEYKWYVDYNFPIILPKSFKTLFTNSPKNKKEFSKQLNARLREQYDAKIYQRKAKHIARQWRKKEKYFFQIMENYNIKIQEKYYCYITRYGPQGQFQYPNTLDIRVITAQDVRESCMVMAHELVHLLIYNKTKKMKLNYEKTEGVVDLFFRETELRNIFPMHGLQTTAKHDKKMFQHFLR